MRSAKPFHFVIVTVSLYLAAVTSVQAQVAAGVATAIATELAGQKVSDIVDDFRRTGTALIDQATASGNALISRGANEANVLARNMALQLRDQLDETFDDLDEQRRLFVIEAEAIRRDLAAVKDEAYEIKDTAALDLNALVTSFPFVKDEFFVQAVRGLAYLPTKSRFELTVLATTLGIQENVETQLRVLKGHDGELEPINDVRVDQSRQRFTANISIPNDTFADSFRGAELSIVPITLRFDVTRTTRGLVRSRNTNETFDVPVYLTLYPSLAGTTDITSKHPNFGWVDIGTTKESYSTPNRHCSKNCRGEPTRGGNRIDLKVSGGPEPHKVGDRRLKNLAHRCVGGNCGFSDSFRTELTDFNTKAYATWDTWSTSGTWELTADIEEYQVIGEKTHTSLMVPFHFNRLMEFMLPAGWTRAKMRVTTFTGDTYELSVGAPDPNGLLTYEGKSDAEPGRERVAYRVTKPAF